MKTKLLLCLSIIALTLASCTKEEGLVAVTGVAISPESLSIAVGEQKSLTATISPKDATNKKVRFSSSKESVATVTQDGIVEGLALGDAIVTVTTEEGNYKAYCYITVMKKFPEGSVDLGLSVAWASCNIGASMPEEYGTYFAWGDVTGQTWNGSEWSGGGFSTFPTYELDANGNLKPKYDAAHVNLGGSWRMPTHAEQQELIDNCTSTWTSDYNGTGVAGRIFTGKKEGYTDKSIFLPAAGYGFDGYLSNAGSSGSCWSSTFYGDSYAWYLNFHSDDVGTDSIYRSHGFSVRPVSEL